MKSRDFRHSLATTEMINDPLCSLRFHGDCLSNIAKTLEKHQKVRFLSCPQDRSTLYFQLSWQLGFFAFLANCVSYLLSTFYALLTDGPLVSRPVSRQSRLRTLVFPGKTGDFAVEVVGFELGKFES